MKLLFVGDTTDCLEIRAKKTDRSASLVVERSADKYLNSIDGVFYTSLGEFNSIGSFCDVLLSANEIVFVPPSSGKWSSPGIEPETIEHLYQWSFVKERPVSGLVIPDFLQPVFKKNLQLHQRVSDQKQIWNYGCSITYGIGVKNDETYGSLINKELGLTLSTIAYPGSGVKWAGDQILSSDIKNGDVVIWGLTELRRIGYCLHDDKFYHLNNSFLHHYPIMKKVVGDKDFLSPDLIYQGLKSIQTVNNFCEKIGATLVMLGVFPHLSDIEYLAQNSNFVGTTKKFIDRGTDGMHPGPRHHAYYAELIQQHLSL